MSTHDFVIVGAGLFGSMAARALRSIGRDVVVIDDGNRDTASRAAGCLFKPGWLNNMPTTDRDRGLLHIEQNYPSEYVSLLNTVTGLRVELTYLPPDHVLLSQDLDNIPEVLDRVGQVQDGVVSTYGGRIFQGTVILAAGVGCTALYPQIPVGGMMGVSLVFPNEICVPQIHVWSPFKQAICVNGPRGVWFGNGVAIKPERWDAEKRVAQAKEQALKFFGLGGETIVQIGCRPVVHGCPAGVLERVKPNLWINTGGYKSGAVLAACNASKLVEEYL